MTMPTQLPNPANASADPWLVAHGSSSGRPLILRMRQEIPAGIHFQDYPFQITIHWGYEDKSNNGLPVQAVLGRMNELEDQLDPLEGTENGFMVFSVTGDQRKEWIWYVRNKAAFIQKLNEALAGHERFPIEIFLADDPTWSAYFDLLQEIHP